MAQGEEEPNGDGSLSILHQLAGYVVDGRNMVGVDGMAQAKGIGKQGCAQQYRVIVKGSDRPQPRQNVEDRQHGVDANDLAEQVSGLIAKDLAKSDHHYVLL